MKRSLHAVGVALLAVFAAAAVSSAETDAKDAKPAAELVRDALQAAADGDDTRRDALLDQAIALEPQFAPARWHRGFVEWNHAWVPFEEVAKRAADDLRLAAYRKLRDETPDTVEGHLELARWCAGRDLVDQQRAHLTRVLERQPDHLEARRLLGHRLVAGTWLSPAEMAIAAERAKQLSAAMNEWRPYLVKTLRELGHRSQARREHGLARLREIDDPAAIEPVELLFCTLSQATALLAVEWLDCRPEQEAAWALARQAVVSPWPKVREAAAAALKTRDVHSYAPGLISAMGSSIQSQADLYRAPNGRLMYRHVFIRRGREQDQVAVLQTEYRNTVLSAETPEELGISRAMLEGARRRDAVMKARLRELIVLQHNLMQQQINDRIAWVLSTATGEDVPATAEHWWQWWQETNEVFTAGTRPARRYFEQESIAFEDPYAYEPSNYPDPPPSSPPAPPSTTRQWTRRAGQVAMYECLVGGTPVWTESGPKSIEQVQVGDRVLSQDPTTGELSYKPVLRTTSRAAEPLLAISAGGETIRASGGHPFWVAGHGWMKARDLEPGQHLHGARGTIEAESVDRAAAEPTYNLIVADHHTYFAGEKLVLSHDNTIREATRAVVPGLVP